MQHVLINFLKKPEQQFFSSLYLGILILKAYPFAGNMIALVSIIHLYHQKNLRRGLNTFWVLKPPNFGNIFQPACLLHPARLLDRLE